jgi:hypothetical protein
MTSSGTPTRRIGARRIPAVVYRAVIDASLCAKAKDDDRGHRRGAEAAPRRSGPKPGTAVRSPPKT